MMRLLLISVPALLLASCTHVAAPASSPDAWVPFWDSLPVTTAGTDRYRVEIGVRGVTLSGIIMVKCGGGEWRGTLVNEFGIRAFDFDLSALRSRLYNVTGIFDRRYVRRTIEGDLQSLFAVDDPEYRPGLSAERSAGPDGITVIYGGKKELKRTTGGTIFLHNNKRGITYTLHRMQGGSRP